MISLDNVHSMGIRDDCRMMLNIWRMNSNTAGGRILVTPGLFPLLSQALFGSTSCNAISISCDVIGLSSTGMYVVDCSTAVLASADETGVVSSGTSSNFSK